MFSYSNFDTTYSRPSLSRTLKGNEILYEIAGVVSNVIVFSKTELVYKSSTCHCSPSLFVQFSNPYCLLYYVSAEFYN